MLNVNQVNQLFVVKSVCTTGEPTNVGDIKVCKNNDNMLYFKYMGKGGLIRSDLISLDVVNGSHDLRGKVTLSGDMAQVMNYACVEINAGTNDENIVAGEEYVLRVSFPHLYDMGDENIYTKYASVKADSTDDASSLTFKIAKDLWTNLSRKEKDTIIKITVVEDDGTEVVINSQAAFDSTKTYVGFIIEAVPQPWERGLMPQTIIDMEVSADPIIVMDEETTDWFLTTKNELSDGIEAADSGSYTYTPVSVSNGKKTADLEYFLMGERGDQYRMMNYPDYVKTEYMVDASLSYDIASIHYSFIGHNEDNKRGEKDLTFVMSDATSHKLAKDLITKATYGINAVAGITLIDGTVLS